MTDNPYVTTCSVTQGVPSTKSSSLPLSLCTTVIIVSHYPLRPETRNPFPRGLTLIPLRLLEKDLFHPKRKGQTSTGEGEESTERTRAKTYPYKGRSTVPV